MKLSKNLSFTHKFILALSTMIIAMNSPLFAAENIGVPQDYQMIFQDAATPNMADITWFHNLFLFPVMLAIALFVTLLLIYVMFKFSAKKNPKPSKTSHNSLIEVLWTVIPVIILVAISIPSFRILYTQQAIPVDADLTVKATGYQWYWGYEYPDENIIFDSYMIETKDLKKDQPRLLAVDNEVVVPAVSYTHLTLPTIYSV